MNYSDAQMNENILRAVTEMGFEVMTPIQEQAIPVLLEGKDVIGQKLPEGFQRSGMRN